MKKVIFVVLIALLFLGCSKPSTKTNKDSISLSQQTELLVSSPVFKNMDRLNSKYTCDGENINPPLKIENIPPQTKSIAIILDDPDAPQGNFVHWLVINIKPTGNVLNIIENSVPGEQLTNDANKRIYWGPCPPEGEHRYRFIVYALDTELALSSVDNKYDFEKAIDGHIFAKGMITTRYRRQ